MTASAVVEERQLLRTLRWWDGFVIALCNPGFLLGSLGFTLGVFGVVVDRSVGHVDLVGHVEGRAHQQQRAGAGIVDR